MVTLIAVEGDDTKDFLVHQEFACHYSPTLNAAFNVARLLKARRRPTILRMFPKDQFDC
jgi:hypothetical protein